MNAEKNGKLRYSPSLYQVNNFWLLMSIATPNLVSTIDCNSDLTGWKQGIMLVNIFIYFINVVTLSDII